MEVGIPAIHSPDNWRHPATATEHEALSEAVTRQYCMKMLLPFTGIKR